MTTRRTILALPVLACAACATEPAEAGKETSRVPGTVTNSTGSVNGTSLTGLQDAYTKLQGTTEPINGTMAQWQSWSLLSDKTGVCGRFNGSQTYQANEITLRVVVTGWKEAPASAPWVPPAADLPLTLTVSQQQDTTDGVHRICKVYFMKAGSNGRAGKDTEASGGTVTFTAISDTDPGKGQSADYDLWFGSDHVTGSFVAPWC